MLKRFAGTIEKLCDVDVVSLSRWASGLPAHCLPELSDLKYLDWGERADVKALVADLMAHYPGGKQLGFGLWLMWPGQVHHAHRDQMRDEWVVRLHVPVITNNGVVFTMDDGDHRMALGSAYQFNALATHAVFNGGDTVRLHFMMDVGES